MTESVKEIVESDKEKISIRKKYEQITLQISKEYPL